MDARGVSDGRTDAGVQTMGILFGRAIHQGEIGRRTGFRKRRLRRLVTRLIRVGLFAVSGTGSCVHRSSCWVTKTGSIGDLGNDEERTCGWAGNGRVVAAILADHAAQEIQKRLPIRLIESADVADRFLEPPEHHGRVALER